MDILYGYECISKMDILFEYTWICKVENGYEWIPEWITTWIMQRYDGCNELYENKSLHALFKFSGAQATRRIPRAQLSFREESLFI
jgi:hypothetical protein